MWINPPNVAAHTSAARHDNRRPHASMFTEHAHPASPPPPERVMGGGWWCVISIQTTHSLMTNTNWYTRHWGHLVAGGCMFSGLPSVRHILWTRSLQNASKGFLQIWYKRWVGLTDELIRFKRSKVTWPATSGGTQCGFVEAHNYTTVNLNSIFSKYLFAKTSSPADKKVQKLLYLQLLKKNTRCLLRCKMIKTFLKLSKY